MQIDNYKLIIPLLNFENKGDFYMLYVFKRKKDQEDKDNHQSVRTIKTYCVESIESLEKKYDEVISLCEMFKARAYIHVQKQNHRDVGLSMMVELAQRLKDGINNQSHLFESVVSQLKVYEKRWVVDIDSQDIEQKSEIRSFIDKLKPIEEKTKLISIIPTHQGVHLITKPFDLLEFRKKYSKIDIQKKNPTLLYYPSSL